MVWCRYNAFFYHIEFSLGCSTRIVILIGYCSSLIPFYMWSWALWPMAEWVDLMPSIDVRKRKSCWGFIKWKNICYWRRKWMWMFLRSWDVWSSSWKMDKQSTNVWKGTYILLNLTILNMKSEHHSCYIFDVWWLYEIVHENLIPACPVRLARKHLYYWCNYSFFPVCASWPVWNVLGLLFIIIIS